MRERFATGFDPFVIPFIVGMLFVLSYCLIAMVRVVAQLPKADRKRFLLSLITPKYIWMPLTARLFFLISSTARAVALSIPRLISIGVIPAETALSPSRTIA